MLTNLQKLIKIWINFKVNFRKICRKLSKFYDKFAQNIEKFEIKIKLYNKIKNFQKQEIYFNKYKN